MKAKKALHLTGDDRECRRLYLHVLDRILDACEVGETSCVVDDDCWRDSHSDYRTDVRRRLARKGYSVRFVNSCTCFIRVSWEDPR